MSFILPNDQDSPVYTVAAVKDEPLDYDVAQSLVSVEQNCESHGSAENNPLTCMPFITDILEAEPGFENRLSLDEELKILLSSVLFSVEEKGICSIVRHLIDVSGLETIDDVSFVNESDLASTKVLKPIQIRKILQVFSSRPRTTAISTPSSSAISALPCTSTANTYPATTGGSGTTNAIPKRQHRRRQKRNCAGIDVNTINQKKFALYNSLTRKMQMRTKAQTIKSHQQIRGYEREKRGGNEMQNANNLSKRKQKRANVEHQKWLKLDHKRAYKREMERRSGLQMYIDVIEERREHDLISRQKRRLAGTCESVAELEMNLKSKLASEKRRRYKERKTLAAATAAHVCQFHRQLALKIKYQLQ